MKNKIEKIIAGEETESIINEIIDRIVNRRVCSNQECKTVYNLILNPPKKEGICDKCGHELIKRKDDTEETVRTRLNVYFDETSPLIDYYEKKKNILP